MSCEELEALIGVTHGHVAIFEPHDHRPNAVEIERANDRPVEAFGIDLDEVRRVIDAAEVLVVRFSITDRRLLIDTRTNGDEGPMIKVVPPVTSGEERFKSLKILRPRFRSPERILTFQWPRHARALVEAGLWEHMARRLVAIGWSGTAAQCDEALHDLLREEGDVERAAIRGGDGFKTLWAKDMPIDE